MKLFKCKECRTVISSDKIENIYVGNPGDKRLNFKCPYCNAVIHFDYTDLPHFQSDNHSD